MHVKSDSYSMNSSTMRMMAPIIMLALIAALSIVCVGTAEDSDAETSFTVNGINYTTTSDTEVKVVNDSYSGAVTIPSSVIYGGREYDVTAIDTSAFSKCSGLTSVIVGDKVITVGNSAFSDCTNLSSVVISDSVTSIGRIAFYNCTSLISMVIPDNVLSVGYGVFMECSGLTSVTFGCDVISIGEFAFFGCTSLTEIIVSSQNISYSSVDGVLFDKTATLLIKYPSCKTGERYTIPNSVTVIGEYAFSNCSKLISVDIPNNVTTIGDDAFSTCSLLTSVIIPDSVRSIGEYIFVSCSSLTSVVLSKNIESISFGAFNDCSCLESVIIPDSATSICDFSFSMCSGLNTVIIGNNVSCIDYQAFYGCSKLVTVSIPDSVTSIGEGVFSRCTSLVTINVSPGNVNYCSVDGVLFDKGVTSLIQYPAGKTDAVYAVPETVTTICGYAFCGCSVLSAVDIPDNVTKIEYDAFSYCSALRTVALSDCISVISSSAFDSCSSLTSIVIPDSVTAIRGNAFRNCYGLVSLHLGAGVESIDSSAFFKCISLKNITVADDNKGYSVTDDVLFNKEKTVLVLYPAGKACDSYAIPDTVVEIRDYAFESSKIVSMTIPSTVNSLDYGAFYGSSVEEVTVSCEKIENYAFGECSALKTVSLSGLVTEIGYLAFQFKFIDTDGTTVISWGKSVKHPEELPGFTYIRSESSGGFVRQFNVIFDENGGSVTVDDIAVKYDSKFILPGYNGTKDGKVFGGWSYDGEVFAPGTEMTKTDCDMEFTAVWKVAPGGTDNTGLIIGLVIVAVIVIITGAYFLVRGRN